MKKLFTKICSTLFIFIFFSGFTSLTFAQSECILTEQEIEAVSQLSENFELPLEGLKSLLSFKVGDNSCFLVPVCDSLEHKNCFLKLYSHADPLYMQYFRDGSILSEQETVNIFNREIQRINTKGPNYIVFLIKSKDDLLGLIRVGPMIKRMYADTELSYLLDQKYSKKGVMGAAVTATMKVIEYLRSYGPNCYDFNRIFATASPGNIASNKILASHGFEKQDETIVAYGVEKNVYFYYFDPKS